MKSLMFKTDDRDTLPLPPTFLPLTDKDALNSDDPDETVNVFVQ